jgi:hypothetical protein
MKASKTFNGSPSLFSVAQSPNNLHRSPQTPQKYPEEKLYIDVKVEINSVAKMNKKGWWLDCMICEPVKDTRAGRKRVLMGSY